MPIIALAAIILGMVATIAIALHRDARRHRKGTFLESDFARTQREQEEQEERNKRDVG